MTDYILYHQVKPGVDCPDGVVAAWAASSDKDGNNTDVGAIAARLGGGGHRNASGFRPRP